MEKVFLPRLRKLVEVYNYQEGIDIINSMIESTDTCVKAYSKKTKYYSKAFLTFDIETTKIKNINVENEEGKEAFFNYPYTWQVYTSNGYFIFGRKIEEYFYMMDKIYSKGKYIITFIHNAAFEYNNLANYFIDRIKDDRDIFFKKSNTPLFFRINYFLEYRCTYLLTRKSLAKLSKEAGLEKGKDFDYTIQRDSETELKPHEIEYCYKDVYNLTIWLKNEIRKYNKSFSDNPAEYDNVAKLPLTQTGYVRADIKRYFSNTPIGKKILNESALDEKEYTIVNDSYFGAFTHASPRCVGKIYKDVEHIDLTSAYPGVMATRSFPTGKPHCIYDARISTVFTLISKGKHVIATYLLENVELKKDIQFGYIPYAHCKGISKKDVITENGKLISASKVVITMNEIDLSIINKMYNYDVVGVTNLIYFNTAPLPIPVLNVLFKYFDGKTSLKDIDNEEYMLSKNKLNGIYGMAATALLHDVFKLDGYNCTKDGTNYTKAKVLPYQWGTYITAYVRQIIVMVALKLGVDFLYADTDSLFYTNGYKYVEVINEYNEKCIRTINELNNNIGDKISYNIIPETSNGEKQYLLYFASEKKCQAFMTLGAKRYCIYSNGKYELTWSGLSGTKIEKDGTEGFTVRYIREKFGSPFYAMRRIFNGEKLYIPYIQGYGKLSNYIQRGDYTGYINGKKVTAKASMVLYEQDTHLQMTPDIIEYLIYLKNTGVYVL